MADIDLGVRTVYRALFAGEPAHRRGRGRSGEFLAQERLQERSGSASAT
jgi:hypothetical protein